MYKWNTLTFSKSKRISKFLALTFGRPVGLMWRGMRCTASTIRRKCCSSSPVELRLNLMIGAEVQRQEFSNSSTACLKNIGDSARFVQQNSTTDKREYIAALMTQETLASLNGVKLLSSNDLIIALNSCRTCSSSLHIYKTINSIVR